MIKFNQEEIRAYQRKAARYELAAGLVMLAMAVTVLALILRNI